MDTINQIRRIRLQGLRSAKRSLKELDTRVEVVERFLTRTLARKTKMPEFRDVDRLISLSDSVNDGVESYLKTLTEVVGAFQV